MTSKTSPTLFSSTYRTRAERKFLIHAWARRKSALPTRFRSLALAIPRKDVVWNKGHPLKTAPVPPSVWAQQRDWARTLHALVYLHHWALVLYRESPFYAPMEEGRPIHEVAHRLSRTRTGLDDDELVEMIREEERTLRGFVEDYPL